MFYFVSLCFQNLGASLGEHMFLVCCLLFLQVGLTNFFKSAYFLFYSSSRFFILSNDSFLYGPLVITAVSLFSSLIRHGLFRERNIFFKPYCKGTESLLLESLAAPFILISAAGSWFGSCCWFKIHFLPFGLYFQGFLH